MQTHTRSQGVAEPLWRRKCSLGRELQSRKGGECTSSFSGVTALGKVKQTRGRLLWFDGLLRFRKVLWEGHQKEHTVYSLEPSETPKLSRTVPNPLNPPMHTKNVVGDRWFLVAGVGKLSWIGDVFKNFYQTPLNICQ